MTPDILLTIATIVFSAGGSAWVTKWRLDKAEVDRASDAAKRDQEHRELWGALNKERVRIDQVREEAHSHEKVSFEERLRIAEKFNAVALAQSNLSGDLKASVATMARVEKKVDEIVEEMKKS